MQSSKRQNRNTRKQLPDDVYLISVQFFPEFRDDTVQFCDPFFISARRLFQLLFCFSLYPQLVTLTQWANRTISSKQKKKKGLKRHKAVFCLIEKKNKPTCSLLICLSRISFSAVTCCSLLLRSSISPLREVSAARCNCNRGDENLC